MIPRLVTIPFSHYCEKARWALDRCGVAYDEDGHVPIFAYPYALRAGGARTVPVLVTDDGPLTSSAAIVTFADEHRGSAPTLRPAELGEEIDALERVMDDRLGPATRRVAYGHILPDDAAVRAVFETVSSGFERRLAVTARRLVGAAIRRGLKIDAGGVARSRVVLDAVFADVASRLADGRPYLTGDAFTRADLAFAALAAPVVYPDAYARTCIPLEQMSGAVRELVRSYRETPAGRHALRVYARDRG